MKLDSGNRNIVRIPKSTSTPNFKRFFKEDKIAKKASILGSIHENVPNSTETEQFDRRRSFVEGKCSTHKMNIITNIFARDPAKQKNDEDFLLYDSCDINKESLTNEEVNISASSQNEKLIKTKEEELDHSIQHNLRKVASMCNIFSKSASKGSITEPFQEPNCCVDLSEKGEIYVEDVGNLEDCWNEETDLTFLTAAEREDLRSSLDVVAGKYPIDYNERNMIRKNERSTMRRRGSYTFSSRRNDGTNEKNLSADILDLSNSSMKHLIEKLRDEDLNYPSNGIPRIGSVSDMFNNSGNIETALENIKKCQGDIMQSIHSQEETNKRTTESSFREGKIIDEDKDWKLKNIFTSKKERELEVELMLSL